MSETPVCEVCGQREAPAILIGGIPKTACWRAWPGNAAHGREYETLHAFECYRLGYERARAALSAAEKREARLRRELVDLASVVRSGVTALHAIAKAESNPGKQRALEILARGLSLLAEVSAENGGTEASAASDPKGPPDSSAVVPGAQEGEK